MIKIILRKTTNAIFLAIVLIAGTFAALSPSFMVGAQAQQFNGMDQRRYNSYEPEYGMDNYDDKQSYGKDSNSYDKSKDSVTVKKIKCNNINANLNGFSGNEIGASQALSALANEAQAEDEGANGANSGNDGGGGDGRPSGSDTDSRFVCINNNNNVFEEPISELCEECFAANSMLQTAIENALLLNEGLNVIGFFDSILVIGPGTDTIEQLCNQFELSAELFGVPVSDLLLDFFFSGILGVDPEAPNPAIDALIECLLEAGIIVHEETPIPPDSISANGIAGANIDCNGPICAKIEQQ